MQAEASQLSLPQGFEHRPELRHAATPRLLRQRPIHRWFYFPHSYSPELVEAILDRWTLSEGTWLLDPFCGAGTTLLCAQNATINSVGIDLSPLAVRVTNAKTQPYREKVLENALKKVEAQASLGVAQEEAPNDRLAKAFTRSEYEVLVAIRNELKHVEEDVQEFFLLALLTTAKKFSRAVADGGWYRWVEKPNRPEEILPTFSTTARTMIVEALGRRSTEVTCNSTAGDARQVNSLGSHFDALITSPPYPNRHDYSRVYHIELLMLGYTEEEIFRLRHSALRSHVEARRPIDEHETELNLSSLGSKRLVETLASLPDTLDPRIPNMLTGYFSDMFYTFSAAKEVLNPQAKIAFVVGNVRHGGVMIEVDQILAEIAAEMGWRWEGSWVIRYRGNSAQQMGRFGREPARETVVFFENQI